MKVILLGFLSLLTFAETTRTFISPEVELPGDYWEEEKEDDDDENATNVEQSPDGTEMKSLSAVGQTKGRTMEHFKDEVSLAFFLSTSEIDNLKGKMKERGTVLYYSVLEQKISARAPVSHLDDGVDLLKKTMQNLQEKLKFTSTKEEEEESSQEEQARESRLGPHYPTTLIQSHHEELPLDVSHEADLPERNTAQETRKEDCKVNVVLIVSCVAVACIFIVLICCWIAFIKYRVKTWIVSTAFRGKFP